MRQLEKDGKLHACSQNTIQLEPGIQLPFKRHSLAHGVELLLLLLKSPHDGKVPLLLFPHCILQLCHLFIFREKRRLNCARIPMYLVQLRQHFSMHGSEQLARAGQPLE